MPFLILGGALLAIAVAFFIILRWCYVNAFYHPPRKRRLDAMAAVDEVRDEVAHEQMVALTQVLVQTPFERVSIRSRDGLLLTGRYYHITDSNRLEILFHGWRSNALRDSCGGAKIARDCGFNQLIVDQRAHGSSEGCTITFGIKEKYDCLDWVSYAVERFGDDVQILLGGVSMGAATVLMASELPLPPNVKAITADCGYTSPEAIIRKVCRDRGIPDRLGYPFARASARLLGGFSLVDGGAVEAVRHASVPIMLMHGEEDDFVPYAMAHEIRDACASPVTLLSMPRAGHGTSYFYDPEGYARTVGEFKMAAFEDRIGGT